MGWLVWTDADSRLRAEKDAHRPDDGTRFICAIRRDTAGPMEAAKSRCDDLALGYRASFALVRPESERDGEHADAYLAPGDRVFLWTRHRCGRSSIREVL